MLKPKKQIIIPIIAVIVILAVGYVRYIAGRNHHEIIVSGNIEATDVRLAFRAGGTIRELLTDEGMAVRKGDCLARLDTDELSKIKNEAEAALRAAEFTGQRAREDYERLENLFQAGAISAQKRDTAKTAAAAAGANSDALRAGLDLANTRLGFAELISPLSGVVLTKSAEAGEVVAAGATIVTVADLNNVWLTAYINESDLGKVKLGQASAVTTDSYPKKTYPGRISFISQESEFTPKQIQTTEERVKLVYRVKIMVDNSNQELKPGMPADAEIKIE
ncbi:MAG: efflux RND transporter periplasmic adaptor subunit [Candidatus Omnitrophica bacterium]|nr:efflux RND transporter periplasmic adaptor subunit [Candidatus Omnitrophota bacterium]